MSGSFVSLFWAGFNYHVVDILRSFANIKEDEAANTIFLPLTVATTPTVLVLGYFSNKKYSRQTIIRVVGWVGIYLSIIFFVSCFFIIDRLSASIFALFYGVGVAAQFYFSVIVYGVIFGTKDIGKIQGLSVSFGVATTGLGPVLFGVAKDYFAEVGSYRIVIIPISLALFCIALSLVFIQLPKYTPSNDNNNNNNNNKNDDASTFSTRERLVDENDGDDDDDDEEKPLITTIAD